MDKQKDEQKREPQPDKQAEKADLTKVRLWELMVNGEKKIVCGPIAALTTEYIQCAIQMAYPRHKPVSHVLDSGTGVVTVVTTKDVSPPAEILTTCGRCDGTHDVDDCPFRVCDLCRGKHWIRMCPIILKEARKKAK